MKKLLLALGLTMSLLTSVIIQQKAQAQNITPAYAYQIRSSVGTFTDISDKPGVVRLGTDLEAGADLKNMIFLATSETDATPTHKTNSANATTLTLTDACFPLGFDFKISGKPMRYFVVSAFGGAYFSDTPLRVATNTYPDGKYITNCVFAHPYLYNNSNTMGMAVAGKVTVVDGKAPACYLISGTAGNHVLTVQHDYLVAGGDEWIFQFKFYEATGHIDFISKQIKADNAPSSSKGDKRYQLAVSLAVNSAGNSTTPANNPFTALNLSGAPANALHLLTIGQSAEVNLEKGWDSIYITGAQPTSLNTMFIEPGNFPKEGRTFTMLHPAACPAHAPALTADHYRVSDEEFTPSSYSANLSFNEAKFPNDVVLFEAGTILAVLSASERPDYTLSNGTLYQKGNKIGTAEVLCNQTPKITYNSYYATNYLIQAPIPISITGLSKGETRYIHLYAMSYTCDGYPVYSELCHTLSFSAALDMPKKLAISGQPGANAVTLDVAPADGYSVILVKSSRPEAPHLQGQLQEGDLIGNDAQVVKILNAAGTPSIPLTKNEMCYFFAYTANLSNPAKPIYAPNALSISVRAAFSGLPVTINFAEEYYTKPVQNQYRYLPTGWDRAEGNYPSPSDKSRAFGLSVPSEVDNWPACMYAQIYHTGSLKKTPHEFAIVTPSIVCDKDYVAATFDIAMLTAPSSSGSDNGVSQATPNSDDNFVIEYKFGSGSWTQAYSAKGSNLPAANAAWHRLIELPTIDARNFKGQTLYFRFRYKGLMRQEGTLSKTEVPTYVCINAIEVKEFRFCKTPAAIQSVAAQTTDTEIQLSWTDMSTSTAPAQSFTVFYKPETAETYEQTTVNTPTAQLTGLQPQTTYAVHVTANCGDKGESENSLPASFTTLHAFPYTESMTQDPNIIKMINGKPVSVAGPGPFARGLRTATGLLPDNGSATTMNYIPNPITDINAFTTYDATFNTLTDPKAIPTAVGVRENVMGGWLITPGIYLKDNTLPLKLKFKANSAHMEGNTWVKGSLPSAYGNVKLSVLVSSNGNFTKNDVKAEYLISAETVIDKEYAIELPALNGQQQLAFYFYNPDFDTVQKDENEEAAPEMLFEVYDLAFGYQGRDLKLDVQPAGAGSVTGAGEYPVDMSINLTATPKPFYEFIAWKNGDNVLTTETAYTFNMPNEDLTYTAHFRPLKHLVTLNVMPGSEAGTVTGNGIYLENEDQVTIKATPKSGYRFVAWMQGEDRVSTDATYTFKMPTADVTYTAKFAPIRRVNLDVTPPGTGSVTGAGGYIAGEQVSIKATPAEDYAFVAWMNGETELSKDNPYTFTMPDAIVDYTALFRSMIHELTVIVASGRETGTVAGEGDYKEGTDVTLTATAKTGYRFKAWMNGETELSKDNPYTFTMPAEDVKYQAVFEPLYTLTLNPDPAESGSVSGDDDYVAGESVTITATASENYEFVAWMNGTEQVSTEATYTFDMPAQNLTYTAQFRSLLHVVTLNVVPGRHAGWTKGGGSYKEGTKVEIEATAYAHHRFVAWKNGEKTLATTAKYTFDMPVTDVAYTAVFDPLYALTLEKTTGGSVATAQEEYAEGESVTITATPDENYAFVAWMNGTEQVSTEATYTFNMPMENLTYQAVFRSLIHKVTVTIVPHREAGAVSGETNYKEGTDVTLTATPKTDYRFKAWMNGTTELSKNLTYAFKMPAEDVNYQAVFEPLYTLTLNKTGLGTVSGAKQYAAGESVTITATPGENFAFVAWMNGTEQVSTEATYTFDMPAQNLTYTAKFESTIASHVVSLSIAPSEEAGTVTGEGVYEEGATVSISATAYGDYAFVAWMNGETKVSEANPYTFAMPAGNVNYTAKFRTLKHDLTLNVSPDRHAGWTTGGGTYKEGTKVGIEATAYAHHYFVAWKNGETQVSTENPYTFTMPATNVTYTAVFDSLYALTLEKTTGGSVATAKAEYAAGESVTVKATADENYAFVAWMNGETQVSTDATYTFNMPTGNLTYKAVFRSLMHEVTVIVKPNRNYGTVNGEGSYKESTAVTLTATAKPNHRFKAWMKGETQVSTENPYTFNMPAANVNYEALFDSLYTLTLSKPTGGTVTGAKQYAAGESVTLTATAEEDHAFVAWMKGETQVSTENPYTFDMPAENLAYTAKFRPLKHDVTLYITPGREAGLTKGGGTYKEGTPVTVTAEAYDGYEFVAWMKGETLLSKDNPYTFTMPAEDVAYTAKFKETDVPTLYNVTLNVTPANAGTVTGGGLYAPGLSISIRATAKEGYKFVAWKNGETTLSTEANYTFTTPEEDVVYTAVFEAVGTDPEPTLYNVTLNVTPANAGSVTGHGQYEAGKSVTITATANDGYTFVAWKNGETTVAATASHTFTMPEEDVAYTAVFEANGTGPVEPTLYNVTLNVTPQNAGSVTGHGQYEAGKSVSITATANEGYQFVAWKNGETTVATTASHTFTMPEEDVAYTAVFEANGTGPVEPTLYNVTLNVTPQNAGSVTGHGQYEAGKSVTITATANDGYKFVAWKNGETTVATTASHTFSMPEEDVAYTAVFEANGTGPVDPTLYNVTLNVTPKNAGIVTGNGQYEAGKSVTITATPNNGYKFVAWKNGETTVATTASHTFNMPAANITYTAVFVPDVANEKTLKSAFSLAAMDGKLHIHNLNGVTVKTVDIYSLNGYRLHLFSPNSRENLVLPVDAERMLLLVHITTEQGTVVYKVYLY